MKKARVIEAVIGVGAVVTLFVLVLFVTNASSGGRRADKTTVPQENNTGDHTSQKEEPVPGAVRFSLERPKDGADQAGISNFSIDTLEPGKFNNLPGGAKMQFAKKDGEWLTDVFMFDKTPTGSERKFRAARMRLNKGDKELRLDMYDVDIDPFADDRPGAANAARFTYAIPLQPQPKRRPRPLNIPLGRQKGPSPGYETTVDLGEGVKLTLCWCPPGTFIMGSPSNEAHRGNDETQHHVTLTKGFWMGKYEVTVAQWVQVMGRKPSDSSDEGKNSPVIPDTWEDCREFIQNLNTRVPRGGFRLPTEAEWEYACRAGTPGPYAGDKDAMGWYNDNGGGPTHEVGQKTPNAWGLHDMHGNLWERCSDWYGDYPAGEITDPKGPISGTERVIRGGSWNFSSRSARSATRAARTPDKNTSILGLRLARSPQL
jgi:hypothetical protein